jgi:hypothetical protein
MDQNQTTNSSDRIRGLEIALKLFEICGPATLKLDDADKATEAIVKAAGEIAQFINAPSS